MFSHHTKNKGDFGVLKCQISLYEQGYLVLTPNTEHSPFDLVAYKDGVFKITKTYPNLEISPLAALGRNDIKKFNRLDGKAHIRLKRQ